MKPKEKLYPILYNGKKWYEKDCHHIFLWFYYDRDSLNELGGVYMGEGELIYPDGKIDEL